MKNNNKQFNRHPSLLRMAGFNESTDAQDIHLPQSLLVNEGLHPRLLIIDRNCFIKTKQEKSNTKIIKNQHKKDLIKAGKNPRIHMNLTSV